jgi:hypothetical protein
MRNIGRSAVILAVALGLSVAGTALAGNNGPPTVVAASATDVSSTGATLRGYVSSNGEPTTYHFEYGTSTAYGLETAAGSAGKSDTLRLVTASVGGLEPGTTYHFRLVATNKKGAGSGSDGELTTASVASPDSGSPAPPGDPGQPGQPGPTQAPGPAPRLGSTVTVGAQSGSVRVRLPGTSSFAPLTATAELPVGSELDASRGTVALAAALPSGAVQRGRFGGGRFEVRQRRSGLVDLYLRGRFCPRRQAARHGTAAAAGRRRGSRRLWGRDRGGRFRTHGRNSHATVRGTRWLVADRCDGTLTRVTEGTVVVRDLVRHRRLVLDAGERYLARNRR